MRAAYSVLPATVGLLVKFIPKPVMPLVFAFVACALVISKRFWVSAVFDVAVLVPTILRSLPVVSDALVNDAALPVVSVEVILKRLFAVSHPNPELSDVSVEVPLKKAIWPEVPVPDIPPDPTVQVTKLFEPLRQIALPVPEERPVKDTVPATVVVSRADAILMVSATELLVPILTVFPAVPVPMLIVFALLPVARLTVPVVPVSKVTAPVVPEVSESAVPAPLVMAPVPAKPSEVAEVEIVSIEATPVSAPPVVTFKPPLDARAKVPVALPMVMLFVPVPSDTAPLPLSVKAPDP